MMQVFAKVDVCRLIISILPKLFYFLSPGGISDLMNFQTLSKSFPSKEASSSSFLHFNVTTKFQFTTQSAFTLTLAFHKFDMVNN